MFRPSTTATATKHRGEFATGGTRGEQGMQAGQTLAGKYRLNRVLGTGGMATVWSATNVFTDREFAVKVMLPQVARTPEAAKRFLLEARVSARIDHPSIIDIIDVGQGDDGSPFLVMELLSGASLDVAVRRSSPPILVHEFLAHMREVAQALAAAHRCGVIHRDLKPTNIFLHRDRDGRVLPKVLDFGVSKVLEEGHDALTVVGTILGSPLYMSPEQAMGADGIDGRTDVFAFGSILFESLCGQRAYDASNLNALIVAIATTAPKSIDDLAPHLPEGLRSLVRECMVPDKEKRLASFDAVLARLDALLLELAGSELRLPVTARKADTSAEAASGDIPRKRTSDRPPPTTSGMGFRTDSGTGTPSTLSLQSGSSRLGPQTSSSSPAWLEPRRAPKGRARRLSWAAAGLLVVAGVGAGAAFARRAGSTMRVIPVLAAAPPPQAPTTAPAVPPSATAPSPNDVPVIPVDSLPVAARAKSEGRLTIGAAPGSCNVYVDGVGRGPTPVLNIGLISGIHRVDCAPPGGKLKTAHVNVPDGGTAHYEFALPND
jgi:eukaryotic-like serine/threonine-protein kinase